MMSRMYKFFAVFALITIACGVSVPNDSHVSFHGKAGVVAPTHTATATATPVTDVESPTWYKIVTGVNVRETPDGMVVGVKKAGDFVLAVCQPSGWCGLVGGNFIWQGCTDRPENFLCESK